MGRRQEVVMQRGLGTLAVVLGAALPASAEVTIHWEAPSAFLAGLLVVSSSSSLRWPPPNPMAIPKPWARSRRALPLAHNRFESGAGMCEPVTGSFRSTRGSVIIACVLIAKRVGFMRDAARNFQSSVTGIV